MVEPAISAAVASGAVPSDVPLAILIESRDPPAIAALIFLCVFTTIIVCGRCISRIFIVKSFGFDDYLAVVSLLMLIAFVILSIILINLGSGRHIEYIQYVLTESQTNYTETLDFVAHLVYTTALFICRFSGLAFYLRLCKHQSKLSIAIKSTAAFLVAAYLPQIFLIIFHCSPVTSLWPYAWQPTAKDFVCLEWGLVYSVNSGLSVVCDVFLFVIPVFMIYSLKTSRARKINLSFVLLPGVLVIIISIVRLYLVVQGQWLADGSWVYCPMLAIETAEIGCTLIALSVPGLKPLVAKWFGISESSSVLPKSHSAGVGLATFGSLPTRRTKVGMQLESEDDPETGKGASVRMKHVGPSESDDSLVERNEGTITIRSSLHISSHSASSNVQLENYPRNWEHN